MKKLIFLIVLYLSICGAILGQDKTALICGTIITGTNGSNSADKVIFIEGEKIVDIGNRATISSDYKVIDLTEYTVLPGLIDAHTHPMIYGDDYQANHLKNNSAEKALYGLKTVQNWLNEGWTTIRVAGDADVYYAHFAIRDAINEGLFEGPRIFGAGHYISITGGGGDINDISHEQQVIPDGLIADGPVEMIKAIRNEIKNGSDWIKLLVTGAFMSAGDNPQNVQFSDEEISAAVKEANRRGIPVMAHAHATEGIKQAIRLGARSIEHGTFLDDECIDLFLEYDAYLIPTIYIGEYFIQEHEHSQALSKAVALTKQYRETYMLNYARAIRRGVKIGVGSDNVGYPPNFAAKEFGVLVELGMSPLQAIQAGTKINAELLMKEDEIGTIEIGKFADIIATRGNPLDDITELERVKFVMKGGSVIKFEQ